MNKTKFAFTLSAAIAVGLVASSFAEQKLSASVSGSTPTYVGGSWNTGTGITAPTCEDGYFVFDNDETCSNKFTATSAIATGKSATCEFDLLAASVPLSVRLTPDSGAKTAFCIVTNTTSGGASTFCAWVKDTENTWVDVSATDVVVPTDGDSYKLKVEFDFAGDTKKVRFAVKVNNASAYTNLTATSANADAWFTAASTDNKLNAYDFIGEGKVASFTADEYSAPTAEVVVGDKKVVVSESTKSAVDTAAGGSDKAAAFLASTAQSTYSTLDNTGTVSDNIALGLLKENASGDLEVQNSGKIIVSKSTVAKTTADSNINLNVGVTPGDTNATLTYQVVGRNSESDEWTNVGSSTTDASQVKIPVDGTLYKYYKVKTTVTYPSNN